MEAVIEAILFTMGESVELKKIAAAIEHDEATTRKIIHRLQDKYEAEDRGLRIIWYNRRILAKIQYSVYRRSSEHAAGTGRNI